MQIIMTIKDETRIEFYKSDTKSYSIEVQIKIMKKDETEMAEDRLSVIYWIAFIGVS